jgi:DNA invertase Pin-like site-specific DNA recombinase
MKCILYGGYLVIEGREGIIPFNLREIALQKGWEVKAFVLKSLIDLFNAVYYHQPSVEHKLLFEGLKDTEINLVVVDNIAYLGRRVSDILNFVNELHDRNVALYIQQLDMISLVNGKEDITFKLLLQMMASAVEIEEKEKKRIRRNGIEKAKRQGKYTGRKKGAKASDQKLLEKYKNIIELLKPGNLSLRKIAHQTNHSVNTVQKIKRIISRI